MQCILFTRTWYFRFVSCVCCMHPTLAAEPYLTLLQSSAMALFPVLGSLVPIFLLGQCGSILSLSWIGPSIWKSCSSTKLQCALCQLSPVKFLLMDGAFNQTTCLSPAHCWAHSWNYVCSFLPFSLGQESLWDGAYLRQGCLYTSRFVVLLCMDSCCGCFGRCKSARKLRVITCSISKDC